MSIPEERVSTHPGEVLREEFLVPLGLSAGELARHLDCPEETVTALAEERVPVTGELAWLLSMAFGTSPESWMNLQSLHDLTRSRPKREVGPLLA